MAQDFVDGLEVLDFIYDLLDNKKADLGIKYIARIDENLIPEYPAVLVNLAPITRELHATQMFRVVWNITIWVFHAELTVGKAIRSKEDIELATNIRKLLHEHRTLDGHIVHGYVNGEFPGETTRVVGTKTSSIVTTRLSWEGENRVRFQDS
jgi:hypothetical protein